MIPHFFTNQLQATIDYYTRVLLFDLVLHPGELSESSCMLQLGDATIIFEETSDEVNHRNWGKLHLFVDNLENAFQNVADFADVRTNPENTEAKTCEFTVRDCNGLELVFSQVQPVDSNECEPIVSTDAGR